MIKLKKTIGKCVECNWKKCFGRSGKNVTRTSYHNRVTDIEKVKANGKTQKYCKKYSTYYNRSVGTMHTHIAGIMKINNTQNLKI